jgi:hypothetical protein
LVLLAIPVATFGGVDRGFEVEVVAGAYVYPADLICVQWDSSPAIWKAISSCVQEVDSFGDGSVMMWAAISNDRKTDIVHVPCNLKYGLLGLMLCCRSRLRTVCELILRNPSIPIAVVDTETVRFRR